MLRPDTAPAPVRMARPSVSFAQVLAREAIVDAGGLAWQRIPAAPMPGRPLDEARLADGSRVAVWRSCGAYIAARVGVGNGAGAAVVLAARPTVEDAIEWTALARIAVGG
jgi:hypothetical protein